MVKVKDIFAFSMGISSIVTSIHSYKAFALNTWRRTTLKNIYSNRFAMSSFEESPAETSESRSSVLIKNLQFVQENISSAAVAAGRDSGSIRLVAVSKTKPGEDIKVLYDHGHRNFGENYFQELVEKAASLPSDIEWNFIGHLQSSKAPKLIRDVPNLAIVETVDSLKLAKKLHSACESVGRDVLRIYIQVDTSNEDTKSGVSPEELEILVRSIVTECPMLKIAGLMTIGAPGDLTCFDKLAASRESVAHILGVEVSSLELSMGMSGDFAEAIARGATSVRVGSIIFGERAYSKSK